MINHWRVRRDEKNSWICIKNWKFKFIKYLNFFCVYIRWNYSTIITILILYVTKMYNKPNKSRKKTIQIERVLTLDNVQTVQKKNRKRKRTRVATTKRFELYLLNKWAFLLFFICFLNHSKRKSFFLRQATWRQKLASETFLLYVMNSVVWKLLTFFPLWIWWVYNAWKFTI